ncbi:hypothetical protein [Halomarina ordinaria]|uniref:Uncharacterized protein n=1 Tax=Halomarina ordinaria TaxID=3033939 RepID=A0ABD5U852_9EURY|nr:hypothetical protein [Halomarina sp. PSRA2]
MRRITRNLIAVILAVLVVLLALGALPGYLRTGDPYYLTAEPVEDRDGPTVNATGLSEQRFPYTTAAVEDGRSDPYWEGPTGLKEAFTHSPFDEMSELDQRDRNADGTDAGAVNETTAYVTDDGTVYRIDLVREDE